MRNLETEFTGHDHKVFKVSKTYLGAAHVHVQAAPLGTLVGSSRIQHLSVHIDDVPALIRAL